MADPILSKVLVSLFLGLAGNPEVHLNILSLATLILSISLPNNNTNSEPGPTTCTPASPLCQCHITTYTHNEQHKPITILLCAHTQAVIHGWTWHFIVVTRFAIHTGCPPSTTSHRYHYTYSTSNNILPPHCHLCTTNFISQLHYHTHMVGSISLSYHHTHTCKSSSLTATWLPLHVMSDSILISPIYYNILLLHQTQVLSFIPSLVHLLSISLHKTMLYSTLTQW